MRRWNLTYPELTEGVGSLPRRAEGGAADKRNGILDLLKRGTRSLLETPLYPNAPTTLGDVLPDVLQGARFIPTGVGDVAELTNLGINMRDPEYRAQLLQAADPDISKPWHERNVTLDPSLPPSLRVPEFNLSPAQMEGLGALLPIVPGMTTWHGSPYKFSRFKSSEIGTGQGAQAYGHGLYFAENPRVAKKYAEMATMTGAAPEVKFNGRLVESIYNDAQRQRSLAYRTKNNSIIEKANDEVWFWEQIASGMDPEKLIDDILKEPEWGSGIANVARRVKKEGNFEILYDRPGALYEVDIPDEEIAKMLDWDAPLGEGSEVSNKIMRLAEDHPKIDVEDIEDALGISEGYRGDSVSGQELYGLISSSVGGDKAASLALNEAGIPGIKYYDQGSRGVEEGTRNFVVFDENLPNIIKTE